MTLAPLIVLAIATLVAVAAFEAEGQDGTNGCNTMTTGHCRTRSRTWLWLPGSPEPLGNLSWRGNNLRHVSVKERRPS